MLENANEKLSVDAFQSGNENENNIVEEEDQSEEAQKGRFKKKMMNELLDEFDDDIDRIKAAGVPKISKNVGIFFWFLILFLIVWGTISEIDTTITASGKITTVVPNVEVQSNYNSVVKEILVKGESVNKGDPLVIFDATLQKADKRNLTTN